ncbi:hypothetical protein FB567DRAFT_598974 [Paraphoma chrysanthemicola]|uniref:DUF7730 domain-containing protein n=1 Tax=Paraphoma chrysanthemicola TaxID=798071 RepID=A0A8K0QSB2_9PLEO|nr:hypothetical protein FB567DRAFT_598974 [Paraphoma chrysanthemicola]
MAPTKSARPWGTSKLPAAQISALMNKITKATKSRKKLARRSAGAITNHAQATVQLLEDGRVDLGRPPEHITAVMTANATRSPLLRLPGELRNKIYEYAIGSYYYHLDEVTHSKTEKSRWVKTVGRAYYSPKDKMPQPTAFHLPEVCRQIYSETATLAYNLNTFILEFDIGGNKDLIKNLLPAQKNAIRSVMPQSIFFERYVAYKDSDVHKNTFRATLPHLRRVEVPEDALSLITTFNGSTIDPARSWTLEMWQKWVDEQVKKKEGDDIEVVFENYDGEQAAHPSVG